MLSPLSVSLLATLSTRVSLLRLVFAWSRLPIFALCSGGSLTDVVYTLSIRRMPRPVLMNDEKVPAHHGAYAYDCPV